MMLIPSKRALQRILRSSVSKGFLLLLLTAIPLLAQASIPSSLYEPITAAYQAGKFQEAEQKLKQILEKRPGEVRALSLMGAVLDAQKRFEEAESFYKKALEAAPNSAVLNNNLGNHYLAQGMPDKAEHAFLRAVALEPRHANANLQLLQIHLQKKEYAAALHRLDQLAAVEQLSPALQLLRVRALVGVGQKEQAQKLLAQLESQPTGDLRFIFSLGMALVEMERFADAEKAFTRVLQADPTNFQVLYNLGTAALRAGHWERAREIYQSALQQRPDDVDCLMGMARSLVEGGKDEQALPFLVQAHQVAPTRADILLLTAQTSSTLGFYSDAAIAYEKYLVLKPDDDVARRERGVALAMSQRLKEGIHELEWYVQKYPKDAWGHFQLASAVSLENDAQALEHINQALQLDPQMWAARLARGVLCLRLRRPEDAIQDLQAFLSHDPENVKVLDQLGRAYLQNNQPQLALDALKKAIDRSPDNPELYFQYSRALRALDRTQELNDVLAKITQLGGLRAKVPPPAGRLDYFTLSPAERQIQDYRNLQKEIQRSPQDPEPKLLLAGLYLRQMKTKEALLLFDQIQQVSPDLKIQARCGRLLVDHELYSNALPFLENVVRQGLVTDEILLDHALAVFHVAGGERGLGALDAFPPSKRRGDYYLLRAQILDSLNKFPEAVEALNLAFRAAPTRPDLYSQACSFLIKHRKYGECLKFLEKAEQLLPNSPQLMLVRAICLELLSHFYEATQQQAKTQYQSTDATEELARIESQRPEWHLPYLIHGIILQSRHQAAGAQPLLETAILLNPDEPSAYYHLALAVKELTPRDNDGAYRIISRGLLLDPQDPFMQTQAGKIALEMEDYPKALGHLQEAIRLLPEMVDAHWLLAHLYRATGENEKQLSELEEVEKLNKLYPPEKQIPMPIQDLLFSARQSAGSGRANP
jgi:protein O-GlcNAc transferase